MLYINSVTKASLFSTESSDSQTKLNILKPEVRMQPCSKQVFTHQGSPNCVKRNDLGVERDRVVIQTEQHIYIT